MALGKINIHVYAWLLCIYLCGSAGLTMLSVRWRGRARVRAIIIEDDTRIVSNMRRATYTCNQVSTWCIRGLVTTVFSCTCTHSSVCLRADLLAQCSFAYRYVYASTQTCTATASMCT